MTVKMMSDEDRDGGKWVRHRPAYRSDLLNQFIEKLDSHAGTLSMDRARFPRDMGSPRQTEIPSCAKRWMLNTEERPAENPEERNIISDKILIVMLMIVHKCSYASFVALYR